MTLLVTGRMSGQEQRNSLSTENDNSGGKYAVSTQKLYAIIIIVMTAKVYVLNYMVLCSLGIIPRILESDDKRLMSF